MNTLGFWQCVGNIAVGNLWILFIVRLGLLVVPLYWQYFL